MPIQWEFYHGRTYRAKIRQIGYVYLFGQSDGTCRISIFRQSIPKKYESLNDGKIACEKIIKSILLNALQDIKEVEHEPG